jgi:thymidylate synthase
MTKQIPILQVSGGGIAGAWEKSLIELWQNGMQIPTEYDAPGAERSRDSTMTIIVEEPFAEPRIHLGFPGGIEDLEKYRQEVIDGIHDSWISPEDGKWTYTYHKRLTDYHGVNQIDKIVEQLARASYSRRAQGITWMPLEDALAKDPPCLQRIWCRVLEEDSRDGKQSFLEMHTHWRSRDAYRAAFMNIYGLTELQKSITEKLKEKTGKNIQVGQYVDISDSYHIYGDSFPDFQARFLSMLEKRDFYNPDRLKSRTMEMNDSAVITGIEYGKKLIEMEKRTGKKGATF